MQMKKKKVTVLLATVVLLANVTACAGNTVQSGATDTESEEKSSTQESSDSESVSDELEYPEELEFETMAEIELGDTIKIDGKGAEVSDGNIVTITKGGEYIFTGSLSDGRIVVNTEDDVEITLNGAALVSSDGPAILGENSDSITINTVKGTENSLEDGSTYATDEEGNDIGKGTIFSNDDLYFTGEGELNVTGNYKHTVKSDDNIFVMSGTINLSATKDGMNANDTFLMDGGTITIENAVEGIEGTYVVVNDGTVTATASDDGVNAATDLQVNGGTLYVTCSNGDALDSNGSMEISGGLVVAHGTEAPECGLDCDDSSILITGGTIIATGGSNSSPDSENDTQYSILLGAATKGDTIGILDADGNTIFAYETDLSYSNLLVSVEDIVEGETYTVYTGGTITGGTNTYGYYEGGTYSGGTESQTFTADSFVISAGGTTGMMGGGRGNMGGQMPENGEKPDFNKMTEDGTMPERGEMPQNGQTPPDGQIPENGQSTEEKNSTETGNTTATEDDSL